MKFGLRYCNVGPWVEPANAIALAQAGEEAGFDSMWTIDHVVVPDNYQSAYPYSESGKMSSGTEDVPRPDPLIYMAYVAAATSRIKIGTAILILPQRNPVVTAKQVATLDQLSGGRILLGIGVGWLKEEFEAIGMPFAARGKRTDEYVAAMRALWAEGAADFKGEFVEFENIYCNPRPTNGTVPIIVGGHSPAAARRAGRIGDGFFPARGVTPELFDIVRRTAEENGRDPDAIEITVTAPEDPADIPKLGNMGVDRVMVPVGRMPNMIPGVESLDDMPRFKELIERYADA